MRTNTPIALAVTCSLSLLVAACGGGKHHTTDAGSGASVVDSGHDSGQAPIDGGMGDADTDAGVDAGVDSGTDAGPSCTGDGGCYACAPSTDLQFLNRCSNSQLTHFDNATRIPGFVP